MIDRKMIKILPPMRKWRWQSKDTAWLWGICLSAFLAVLNGGCLEAIDIDTPPNIQESLVIQGKLVVGRPAHAEVLISKLFTFSADSRQPVNARSVILFDEDGNKIELEDQGQGRYALEIPTDHPSFKVELGRSYGVEVNTFDNRTFESGMELADPVPRMDEVEFRFVEREIIDHQGISKIQKYLLYTVNTPLRPAGAGDRVRLGWEYQHTFKINDTPYQQSVEQKVCYVTENLNVVDVNVIDAAALAADYLDDYELLEVTVGRVYGEGLYLRVIQESLTETAYDYFDQVAENTGRTGNMFEAPPGKVVTNIRNIADDTDEAFGFFYVTQQDTIHKYVDPELVGSPPAYCPPPNGLLNESGNCVDPICCDCAGVSNSTTVKPDYWGE